MDIIRTIFFNFYNAIEINREVIEGIILTGGVIC